MSTLSYTIFAAWGQAAILVRPLLLSFLRFFSWPLFAHLSSPWLLTNQFLLLGSSTHLIACDQGKAAILVRPPRFLAIILSSPCFRVGPPRWDHKRLWSKVISLSLRSPPVAAMDRSISDLPIFSLSAGCCHGQIHKWSPYLLCSPPGCCHGQGPKWSCALLLLSLPPRAAIPSQGLLGRNLPAQDVITFPLFVTPLAVLLEWHLSCLLYYVVWRCFTTSWRRTFERTLRGFWGGCVLSFHLFHQALGWLSCLRSPTTRHAVVPRCGFTGLFSLLSIVLIPPSLVASFPWWCFLPSVASRNPMTQVHDWIRRPYRPPPRFISQPN